MFRGNNNGYLLCVALLAILFSLTAANCDYDTKSADFDPQNDNAADRAALKAFYTALNGQNWLERTKTNWCLDDVSVCHWQGITCDSVTQRVCSISMMFYSNARGSLTPHIGSMTALQEISLKGCVLSSQSQQIPQTWSQLTKLLKLELSSMHLSNELSQVLSVFKNSSKLRYIILDRNLLKGQIPIMSFAELEVLDLSNNKLSESIEGNAIKDLKNLKKLHLQNNNLTGSIPNEVQELTGLRELYLFGNELTGKIPEGVGQLTQLSELILSNNGLQGEIPSQLTELHAMKTLSLSNNKLSGSIPFGLLSLPNMTTINFENSGLSGNIPDEIGPQVTSINLAFNYLTGPLPSTWANHDKIETIVVQGNKLQGIPFTSATSTTTITELLLARNAFKCDKGCFAFIARQQRLMYLDFSDNELDGELPKTGNGFKSLISLDLSSNKLTGDAFSSWELPNVLSLDLSNNNLTGTIDMLHARFPKAQEINLSYNDFIGGIETIFDEDHITSITSKLVRLDLRNNRFTGSLPSKINVALQLQLFNVANNLLRRLPLSLFVGSAIETFDASSNLITRLEPLSTDQSEDYERITLRSLYLNDNQMIITANAMEGLIRMGSLSILELSDNLQLEMPVNLTGIVSMLREIEIWNTKITNEIPHDFFTQMPRLQTLIMSNNSLKSKFPSELTRLRELKVLILDNNAINGSIPVFQTSALTALSMANNSLSGKLPLITSKLIYFDVSHNQFTGSIPNYRIGDVEVFDVSYNRLENIPEDLEQPISPEHCLMAENNFQLPIPRWSEACEAEGNHRDTVLTVIASSSSALCIVVVAVVLWSYHGHRIRAMLNRKSLRDLETSSLAAIGNRKSGMYAYGIHLIDTGDINFIERLGAGAFSVVYRGEWKATEVAVKMFNNPTSQETFQELINEVRFLMMLKHPHVVTMMAAFIENNRLGIVLEYMDKGSLHEVLKKNPEMDWKLKLNFALQIANGMLFLHLQQPPIIHRDLKGMNVLVNSSNIAKITDFGFSREVSTMPMSAAIGTPQYIAPEIYGYPTTANNSSNPIPLNSETDTRYGVKIDVYSYGMLLWEIFLQQVPWRSLALAQITAKVIAGERPPLPRIVWEGVDYTTLIDPANAATESTIFEVTTTSMKSTTRLLSTERNSETDILIPLPSINNDNEENAQQRLLPTEQPDTPQLAESLDNLPPDVRAQIRQQIEYLRLMQRCWQQEPFARPSFREIIEQLKFIQKLR